MQDKLGPHKTLAVCPGVGRLTSRCSLSPFHTVSFIAVHRCLMLLAVAAIQRTRHWRRTGGWRCREEGVGGGGGGSKGAWRREVGVGSGQAGRLRYQV